MANVKDYINKLVARHDVNDIEATMNANYRNNCRYYVNIIENNSPKPLFLEFESYNSLRELAQLVNDVPPVFARQVLTAIPSYKYAIKKIKQLQIDLSKTEMMSGEIRVNTIHNATKALVVAELRRIISCQTTLNATENEALELTLNRDDFSQMMLAQNSMNLQNSWVDLLIALMVVILKKTVNPSPEIQMTISEYDTEPAFALGLIQLLVSDAIISAIVGVPE